MLLQMEGVSRRFGARVLFRDVALRVERGDRVGLVGPNGAGKTSLLRIAAGFEPPDEGSVLTPRGVRVGFLRQEIDPAQGQSVREEVSAVFAALDALERELRSLEGRMAEAGRAGQEVTPELAARYDECRTAFELGGGFERETRTDRVLEGLGFDAAMRERPLASFSGGWLMRVELAKLLLADPDVLLLDEPTNHLDLPSIQWFEETLAGYRGGVVIISHDRTFLRRHATRIAELEQGRFEVYAGGYERYLAQKEARREQLLARKRAQDREIARTERFIERFRAKNTKARQVQSRVKALDRMERVEIESEDRRRLRLRIPPPARSGEIALALDGIHKSYGETRVYTGADFQIRRGERVALAGPNGAGKSTLLRIAAGVLPFDAGDRRPGHNVAVAFYAQHQLEALDPSCSVLAELERGARVDDHPRLRSHLGAFLFSGDDVDKKVSVLSGGEKARLALAKMLLRPANFLVLDEPTNHLDVAACEVLETALRGYPGTLLFISHDRAFIDALATRVVDVRAGRLREYLGNYSDYLRATQPAAAPSPSRAPSQSAAGSAAPEDATLAKQRRVAARAEAKERTRRLERTRKKLAATESEIVELEERLEALGHRLGDPALYQDGADPETPRALEVERAELQAAVDARYRDWERLAAEVEAAESLRAGGGGAE